MLPPETIQRQHLPCKYARRENGRSLQPKFRNRPNELEDLATASARLLPALIRLTGSLPQNVNYALKSSYVTAFLETLPEVSAKLKPPRAARERSLSEIADEVKQSIVLITVY